MSQALIVSSSRGLAVSGIAGASLAIVLIALAALTGGALVMRPQSNASTTSTMPGGQGTTSTSGAQAPGSGVLSILVTDPPHAPEGVTAVYASYSSIQVREEGKSWVSMNSSGEVELMGTVNVGLTLSSAKIPQGTYDAIRLDITSATVTFEGKNYSATVNGGTLLIGIRGGTTVSGSQESAAIIDIQPSIFNIGSATSPTFMMKPVAMAFSVPSSSVQKSMDQEGNRCDLTGQNWWNDYQALFRSGLEINSASVSADSLSVSLKDNGSHGIQVWLVVVTSASLVPPNYPKYEMPMAMFGTATFVVFSNGTLFQFGPMLHMSSSMMGGDQMTSFLQYFGHGYNLTAGATTSLQYSGNITLGSFGFLSPHGIVSGDKYWVTVVGDEAIASVEITAS